MAADKARAPSFAELESAFAAGHVRAILDRVSDSDLICDVYRHFGCGHWNGNRRRLRRARRTNSAALYSLRAKSPSCRFESFSGKFSKSQEISASSQPAGSLGFATGDLFGSVAPCKVTQTLVNRNCPLCSICISSIPVMTRRAL